MRKVLEWGELLKIAISVSKSLVFWLQIMFYCSVNVLPYIVEPHRLKHLWNYENMFETGVVRANEC